MRFEILPWRREVIIHVDDEGAERLASSARDVIGGNKAFLGDKRDESGMLIIRHEDFGGAEEPGT